MSQLVGYGEALPRIRVPPVDADNGTVSVFDQNAGDLIAKICPFYLHALKTRELFYIDRNIRDRMPRENLLRSQLGFTEVWHDLSLL